MVDNAIMETTLIPKCETHTEVNYLWGYGIQPILAVTIIVSVILEIVFKFFLLRRRKRQVEFILNERYEGLKLKENDLFWRILKSKLREFA